MALPFTAEQFFAVFLRYNVAIWPLQFAAYALGALAVALCFAPSRSNGMAVGGILAFFWLWIGAAYHLMFFREINPAAVVFAGLFIVQGALFMWVGVLRKNLSFAWRNDVHGALGASLVLYATLAYPAIGRLLGHGYPLAPMFGVTPCPTAIFTFGILLWTDRPVPKYLLVIPVVWSAIGFFAALSLGVREDFGLSVAAVVATFALVLRDRPRRAQSSRSAT